MVRGHSIGNRRARTLCLHRLNDRKAEMSLDLDDIKNLQDAAKRIVETVTLHLIANNQQGDIMGAVNKWCAFRLSDGTSDNVLYPSKAEAVAHMKSRCKEYCYLRITPDGIGERDAMRFLVINRHPFIDVTAPEHIINRQIFRPSATVFPDTSSEE